MAYKKNISKNSTEKWFWLMLSGAGGVLFSFGLLDVIKDLGWSPFVAVFLGAGITFFAIFMKKFSTPHYVATKRK